VVLGGLFCVILSFAHDQRHQAVDSIYGCKTPCGMEPSLWICSLGGGGEGVEKTNSVMSDCVRTVFLSGLQKFILEYVGRFRISNYLLISAFPCTGLYKSRRMERPWRERR
jgi:hypothetical protein